MDTLNQWIRVNCHFAQKKERVLVSFDFDDTMTQPVWVAENECWEGRGPRTEMLQKMRDHHAQGHTVIIVTARDEDSERERAKRGEVTVAGFIRQHNLPVSDVYFTSHAPKGPLLAQLGVSLHYDDSPDDLDSAKNSGIQVQQVLHPADEITHSGTLPENASEDQKLFWEWRKNTL